MISQNNSGNQEMIWAIQFPSMGGPVGDREFGLIHSTVYIYCFELQITLEFYWEAIYKVYGS